jgi:Immunity protein 50
MENIESLIQGSEKLTGIFGYWPSFHDAEIIDLHFWRGVVEPDQGRYDFPVLTLRIHVWDLTNEVNSKEFLVLKHHTLTTLRFCDVDEFRMEGFNHQNAIFGLSVTHQQRAKGPSSYFVVHLEPAFGMGASFSCLRVEVVDAIPCSEVGKPIA